MKARRYEIRVVCSETTVSRWIKAVQRVVGRVVCRLQQKMWPTRRPLGRTSDNPVEGVGSALCAKNGGQWTRGSGGRGERVSWVNFSLRFSGEVKV